MRMLLRTEWHLKRRSTSPHATTTSSPSTSITAAEPASSAVFLAFSIRSTSQPASAGSTSCRQPSPVPACDRTDACNTIDTNNDETTNQGILRMTPDGSDRPPGAR